jgi:DHA3 family macrolide efflux protein-like MFS transporter
MATPAGTPAPSLRSVFAQPDFRKLWLAQFVSIFGDFLALFGVISFITFRLHGTVVQVTYVTISYMLPLAFVGPVAGVFVDRWNVKRVMIASDLIRAVLAFLLVFVTDIRQICAIFVALSAVSSFFAPAQSVTIRTLVPVERLLAANALMAQAFYTVRIVSPALAGALVAWLTEKSCFYLDAASFVFSALMISTLIIHRPVTPAAGKKTLRGFFGEFTTGNRFILTHATLAFIVVAMVAAMFVLSCFSPLISIYVRDFLHAGSFLFGLISSAVGVGLIVGTQLVNRFGRSRSKRAIVLLGLLSLGIATGILGVFRNTPMAAVSTFGLGFAIAFVIVPAQTLMQQETPRELMGRVSSSFMSLISFAQVLGLLLSGYLAQALGMRTLFQASALALGVLALAGYLRHKATSPVPATTC